MRSAKMRKLQSGQAYVEFAMVLILIITILMGGVFVIRALFLEENLLDVASRAAQWGASTNSNDEIQRIVDEARNFTTDLQVTIDPPDAAHRPIGTIFTVTLKANIPLVSPGLSLIAPLSAQASALIEHNPMRFLPPKPPPLTLQLGDYVRIQTTAGDLLNLRKKPGLDGDSAAGVGTGTFATVVDGPVIANGLRWWKISISKLKISGWCVDKADTVDTLVPIAHSF